MKGENIEVSYYKNEESTIQKWKLNGIEGKYLGENSYLNKKFHLGDEETSNKFFSSEHEMECCTFGLEQVQGLHGFYSM